MKSALLKDSIKEIKNTYKRFLSILVMAFLGVGFFAGMRAASPDMVDTIDQYYKESQVYDIKILSTLGLTNDDIDAISEIDEIENTVGTYETEGKIEIDNKEIITKIMSVEKLNKPILLQGNLPKTQNECVVEDSFLTANHKSIGDTIEVEAEKTKNDEGEEVEYLNKNILKIVGTVKSPLYISRDRGTSSLGSGKIDYYIYVPKENIKANEIYTNIYIKLKNSENYTTSSEKYEEYIAEVKEKIEAIKEEREKARHDKLVDIATRKVKEAEEKLNENKQNAQQQIEEAKQEIENGKNKIEKAEVKLNSSKKEADTKFKSAYNQIQMAKKSIFQNETQLNQKEQEAGQQITELEIKKQELQTQFDTIENNLTQLETQYNQIKDNPNISEEQKQMLENKIQMLKQSKQTIKEGIEQINNGITTGKQEIENAKTQLQNAKNELTKKEKQYEATKTATYSSLENAKIEIEKSKTELEKGEKELEEKQEEFKDKIADAESKLIDSREKIANIENPTWYVLDRYSNTGYNSFIQDTESIENISKVFPIVFFMVALLISLTSMTRMVEEQRTQIGTLKALGYNKLQIASKYVIYAGLACVIGGVLGMSVGFVLLPQIIWTMYQMMYQMTDNIHISFNIIIGGMGLLLICVCIMGATIYAVLKELVQTPSTLMRPKAPKMGKRVLLEKIPFIWKRLSFSQKVTVRNIFRYKKRFLMTIIGILGCTALIVVGFGVRDSIRCIMPNQFEKVFNYDMQIGLKNGLEDEQKQKYIISLQEKTELEKVVETYMTSNIAKNQENEEDVQIIVPKEPKDLDEVINLTDVKTGEKVQLEENAICLTDKVAELLNVKQGDTITLKDSKDKERQVKISNIVENYVYHYVYMSRITYENLYGENYNTNMLFTKNNNLSEEQETNLATEIMNQSEVASISRNSSIMNLLDDTMKSLNYVVIILIYDKEVYSYVTRETVILTAIGIVLGLIGGYFLNYFIIRNL